jgi:glycosyl-4,4'-diaponeurosporenoate acyltransferase
MIFHLPTPITIAIDIAAWFVIHMGVSFLMARQKLSLFDPDSWLYRSRRWEQNGRVYDKFLRLRSWKHRLPDGAAIFKNGFTKKHLTATNTDYLEDFARETCRAELTHWIVFLFGPVFLVWNLWWVGIVMILYATGANLPCIITQRYNRIRLQRISRPQPTS